LRVTAGIAEDRKGWLFRTALSERSMNQSGSLVAAAGITAEIGCHTFRATGITAYLANGGARGRAGKWRRTRALDSEAYDRRPKESRFAARTSPLTSPARANRRRSAGLFARQASPAVRARRSGP
jgi:hypothetical protein